MPLSIGFVDGMRGLLGPTVGATCLVVPGGRTPQPCLSSRGLSRAARDRTSTAPRTGCGDDGRLSRPDAVSTARQLVDIRCPAFFVPPVRRAWRFAASGKSPVFRPEHRQIPTENRSWLPDPAQTPDAYDAQTRRPAGGVDLFLVASGAIRWPRGLLWAGSRPINGRDLGGRPWPIGDEGHRQHGHLSSNSQGPGPRCRPVGSRLGWARFGISLTIRPPAAPPVSRQAGVEPPGQRTAVYVPSLGRRPLFTECDERRRSGSIPRAASRQEEAVMDHERQSRCYAGTAWRRWGWGVSSSLTADLDSGVDGSPVRCQVVVATCDVVGRSVRHRVERFLGRTRRAVHHRLSESSWPVDEVDVVLILTAMPVHGEIAAGLRWRPGKHTCWLKSPCRYRFGRGGSAGGPSLGQGPEILLCAPVCSILSPTFRAIWKRVVARR